MPDLTDFVGARVARFEFPVERGKVREIALATRSTLSCYHEDPATTIPPTLLTTMSHLWGVTWENRRHTVLDALPLDANSMLHAEESLVFHGPPPRVGVTIGAETTIESIFEKPRRSATGNLTFVVLLTTFEDESGMLIAEQRTTGVARGKAD